MAYKMTTCAAPFRNEKRTQRVPVEKYRYGVCFKDVQCDDPKCEKTHPERKRLNICQFDVFFNPKCGDNGCHFEDCSFYHLRRDAYYRQKEIEFDGLVYSVVDSVLRGEDDAIVLKDEYKKCMRNLFSFMNLDRDIFDVIRKLEAVHTASQTLYSSTHISIKGDYYAFISRFHELNENNSLLLQEATEKIELMMRIYPEFHSHTRVVYQKTLLLYKEICDFSESVEYEYKCTIHNYPNLV